MKEFIRVIKFLFLSLFCFLFILTAIILVVNIFARANTLSPSANSSFITALFLLVVLIIYTFTTWLIIGRDPVYLLVPRYAPPEDISPAFAYYLYNEMVDVRLLSCIILDLAMKGYIKIETKGTGNSAKIYLTRLKHPEWDTPYEEKVLIEELFDYTAPTPLDRSIAKRLAVMKNKIENRFIMRRDNYIIGNEIYIIPAVLIAVALGVLPPLAVSNIFAAIINVCFTIFFVVATGVVHEPRKKIIAGIVNTLIFIIAAFADKHLHYAGFSYTQLFYLIGIWITVFYISLIRNVSPLGRKTFEHLNCFKQYIKIAEINRIAASDPTDEERIFCEYLPYAFAMDLYNQWMEKYTYILSKATLEQCVAPIDNINMVSYKLEDIFKIIKIDKIK